MAGLTGLSGKVALIAGGGAIGGGTARRLAEEGCRVMIGDIDGERACRDAAAIAAATGGQVEGLAYDQADEASIAALVGRTVERFGGIDFLHANAADLETARTDLDVLATDMAVYDRMLEVNTRGHVLCTRYALPHIVARRGAIVYTGSGSAYIGEPTRVSYAMSKSAVMALMRHVATRWGPEGVRANAISPGFVLGRRGTGQLPDGFLDMVTAAQRIPVMGEARHIAAMVALLFSDDGAWTTGQVIAIDGGSTLRA